MFEYNFERFFDLSLDLLCIASTDGYFKRINASFQRTLGWTLEELLSRPFIDFIHADDIAATLKGLSWELEHSAAPTLHSFRIPCVISMGLYPYHRA